MAFLKELGDKMELALKQEDSFDKFASPAAELKEKALTDEDRQINKYNARKQDLFEQALYFSLKVFEIKTFEHLNTDLMMEFVCCVLSVVLSHHFQKKDIAAAVKNTRIDFTLVRETMYKYSKKAELRFFENPIMAYLFIKFAENPAARELVLHKQLKSEDTDGDTIMEHNTRQHEVNERILKEVDEMKQEASKILFRTFLKRVEKVTLTNLYLIHNVQTLD